MEKSFKLTIRAAWWVQCFQIIFALPFTIGAVIIFISIFKGSMQSWPLFFVCVFLAYLGWANAFSMIQITDENVTVTVFYGRFRIHWSEVNTIVLNSPLVALIGNGKRVVLSLMLMSKESEDSSNSSTSKLKSEKSCLSKMSFRFRSLIKMQEYGGSLLLQSTSLQFTRHPTQRAPDGWESARFQAVSVA
jgi:hypothetical protein